MALTYRTRQRLSRLGTVLLALLLVGVLVWFCWVIWLERYVVYSRDGAAINFNLAADPGPGTVAAPPSMEETVPIFYNEGDDAVSTSFELTQITGYYITEEDLTTDLAATQQLVATLPPDTAVMMDVKNIYGGFLYTSKLMDAIAANSVNTMAVDSLIKDLNDRGVYTIAKLPAFRDRNYGLNHVPSGLPLPQGYLWVDERNCYWLNPADSGTLNWLYQIVEELKDLGFNEVVFTDFCFPNTTKIVFEGDRDTAIQKAAQTLMSTSATDRFAVSFMTTSSTFKLPEGRSRLFVENVSVKDASSLASQYELPDAAVNLVFLAATNDTRYEEYSVLRPIAMADGG